MKGATVACRLRRSRGVSIVTAIFLLVVLSGIGAAIVTLTTSQQTSSAYELLGARAYEAARTGVDVSMHRLSSAANICTGVAENLVMPAPLAPFTVTVTCSRTAVLVNNGLTDLAPVRITATACNQPTGAGAGAGACPNPAPGLDYVQRVVQATL